MYLDHEGNSRGMQLQEMCFLPFAQAFWVGICARIHHESHQNTRHVSNRHDPDSLMNGFCSLPIFTNLCQCYLSQLAFAKWWPDLIYGPEHVTCKSYYITWKSCSCISTITSQIPFSVIWSVRHAQQQSWNGASNLARSKLMPLFRTGTPWLLLSQPGVAPEKSKAENTTESTHLNSILCAWSLKQMLKTSLAEMLFLTNLN